MRSKRKVYRNALQEGDLKVPLCGFGGVKYKCVRFLAWNLELILSSFEDLSYRVSYHYTVRSDDVKALKSRWNFVKARTTTPGNNIYTLMITFIAFTSLISSKFQTQFFPYKLSYYAWAICVYICYSPAGRSVLGETVPEVLSTTYGLGWYSDRGHSFSQYGPT